MISERSASCVAVVQKAGGAVPLGSGVLIGPDTVLTCAHNITEHAADSFDSSEIVVWLDYEERHFGTQLSNVVCDCQEVYRSKTQDFVILKIRRADNKQPTGRTPIALNGTRIIRWTPIFLVGYPQGWRRTIHDSSWVLFPHRIVSNTEWGDIESAVTAEYLEEQTEQDPNVRSQRAAEKARDFMVSRYGQPEPNATNKQYVLRYEGAEYIGAECDTFEGDSGAPAMLREDGSIIGILFKGMSDFGAAMTSARNPRVTSRPGARFHERILPISNVIADLNANIPQWQTSWGVTIN
jgi:V8-like Glu-specific endopeptidase